MCDCDVLTPDYDESGDLMCREIHLKAKRDVACVECHTNVPAGTGHYFVKGKWDDHYQKYSICEDCHAIGEYFENTEECFCWAFGDLYEELREHEFISKQDIHPQLEIINTNKNGWHKYRLKPDMQETC